MDKVLRRPPGHVESTPPACVVESVDAIAERLLREARIRWEAACNIAAEAICSAAHSSLATHH